MLGLDKETREKVEKHISVFNKILKSCLRVRKEEVLILTDYGTEENKLAPMMAYGYYLAAKKKGFKVNLLAQGPKKGFMYAEDNILRALRLLEEKNVVISSLSNKLGRLRDLGKSFRTFCRNRQHRFISTTGLGGVDSGKFGLFMEAMNVNYGRMIKHGNKLKRKLDLAKEIRVKTEKGTDVVFDVEGMEAVANAGDYKKPGEGGNIPAGEVYIPPHGHYGVEGVVVVDGSMRCDEGTVLLKEPLKLFIEEGKVVWMEGSHKERLGKTLVKFENRAKFPERIRLVAELGIGINPTAVIMGSSILDEKVLGTAHVAIGSNYWFGGAIRTILHLDQVFLNPRIFVDGELLEV